MAQLKVTQTKSRIGGTARQRASLRSLGLKRIGHVVILACPAWPSFRSVSSRGMTTASSCRMMLAVM